jgi:hypothetical protein
MRPSSEVAGPDQGGRATSGSRRTYRLEKALDEADALRGATAEEIAARDLGLSRRLAKIDSVLTLVAGVATST